MLKVNLCGTGLNGFVNVDLSHKADLRVNLEKKPLPFRDGSVDAVICMSAINYFTKERALFLIKDVHRVLKVGGIVRFGVQDFKLICAKYLAGEAGFDCDRINAWFGNSDDYTIKGHKVKYMYDSNTLKNLFKQAGLPFVNEKEFYQTNYDMDLAKYDNRPDQMFYLEAWKAI